MTEGKVSHWSFLGIMEACVCMLMGAIALIQTRRNGVMMPTIDMVGGIIAVVFGCLVVAIAIVGYAVATCIWCSLHWCWEFGRSFGRVPPSVGPKGVSP